MSLEFVRISATVLTFGTLLVAGHSHLRDAAALSAALRLRFRMGPRSSSAWAKLVGLYELALGGTGLASAAVAAAGLRLVTAAALGTYVVYTWHVWSLHTRGLDAPCGCTSEDGPANRGTVARTFALALAAAIAFTIGEIRVFSPSLQGPPVVMLLMGALAGATFTLLLWSLPSAVARE
ncbi:MAG: hypothetical protein M3N32_00610 [Actinomycetota bacterium]|nr:hypothetical protein [Actinomycetota bacterium]